MATPGGPLRLHHWTYGVTPGEGYGIKAHSAGLNISLYEAALRGRYTPIRGETVQDAGGVNSRMLHPASSGEDLLLSRLTKGPPDELGRPTFQNHIAVVPREALAAMRVTLKGVEAALADFDLKNVNMAGETPPLDVQGPPPGWRLGEGLRQNISRAAIETIATRRMADPDGRTLLLCREAPPAVRNEVLFRVVELLDFALGLQPFVAMSDAPTASALNAFNLVVAPRGVRGDNSWAIVEASLENAVLPRVGRAADVYSAIEKSYADDTAEFG
jgi:hypothetical protein